MKIRLILFVAALASCVLPAGLSKSQAQEASAEDIYQIVEAAPDRVWRLNKRTGEIAVCSLEGDHLICSTSSEAATPPAKSFAELESEKQQKAMEAQEQRQAEREQDMEFLDKIFELVRAFIAVIMERYQNEASLSNSDHSLA